MTKVLDLDAELQRSEVTYRGGTYELRNRAELSILEAHKFATLLTDFDHAGDGVLEDADAAAKAGQLLQDIAALLVVEPPSDGFPDQVCAAILGFWTEQNPIEVPADPPMRLKKPQDRKPKSRSTGARSLQGSKRSMAATRKTGSTSRSGR